MSIPPWYCPRRRPLAEAVRTLDLSRTTGIGPLEPGLSMMWDMTPLLCASDPCHRVRVKVDSEGQTLNITRRRRPIATLALMRDFKRIGAPRRALCGCGRQCYRLYLWGRNFRCGRCLRVTFLSGQGETRNRAHARLARLDNRLHFTQWLPRHRGRRKIIEAIDREDLRVLSTSPSWFVRMFEEVLERP